MRKYIVKGNKNRKKICIIVSIVGIIIITTVITKIYSAHHKREEMYKKLEISARENLERFQKSYKDVEDVIKDGVEDANKKSLGQPFDETSITRAIVAIQGLANDEDVLNTFVQERIGYYKNESEKLIAMKKLLDDYLSALENAKNNPTEIAIAADTESLF